MKLNRLLRAVGSINRLPEVARAFSTLSEPLRNSLAYLQLVGRQYPFELIYRGGGSVSVGSWEDLTTVWVVLLGHEYRVYPSDRVIVDLGANIGVFTLLACKQSPDAVVYAIEPFPENFTRLQKCLKVNDLAERVHARAYALAGESGAVRFDADPNIPSHSKRISRELDAGASYVTVPSHTLGEFMDLERIETIDFLKMDIEGAEYPVILAADAPALRRIKRIGLEYHFDGHQKLTDHLETAGFEITYHPKSGRSGVIEYTRQ